MKDFLRHNGIWLLIIALLLSILIGISSAVLGGTADPISNLVSSITAPIRGGISAASNWIDGVSQYILHYDEMNQQIDDLEKEVAQLKDQLRENEAALQENQQLRTLLGLQAKRRDFVFEASRITARSTSNWQSTFTLSKGSNTGVQPGNCVITEMGHLVGVITEVGTNYSVASTIVDTSIEVGGLITRTNSSGVLEGDFALMQQGKLRLSYLPDDAQLVVGDEVLTSGKGDIYPFGLVVGQVEGVFTDASGMNRYAIVSPEAKLDQLVEVFIIKDFDIIE